MSERTPSRTTAPPVSPTLQSEGKAKMPPPSFGLDAGKSSEGTRAIKPGLPTNQSAVRYGGDRSDPVAVQGAGDANRIAPSDVSQGMLGDCFFLASLAAVAKFYPNLLAGNISGPDGDGQYSVRFYRKTMFGTFEEVVIRVRPNFPEIGTSGQAAYAKEGDNQEMWVMLYEKAYAQLLGSYGTLNQGGVAEDALEALTGREASTTSTRGGFFGTDTMSANQIRDNIRGSLQNSRPVVADTHPERDFNNLPKADRDFASTKQIVGSHSYSVLSCDDTHVRLRNPWGGSGAEIVISWAQFRTFYPRFHSIN